VTGYGNAILRRIPYEEWGLKSLPPLTAKRKSTALEYAASGVRIPVLFPPSFLATGKVVDVLKKLATERQELHRKRMIWSAVCTPLTLPFALIPVLPNFPAFYLIYRAWSHYKALFGAKYLDFMVENHLMEPSPSSLLDKIYVASLMSSKTKPNLVPEQITKEQIDTIVSGVKSFSASQSKDTMLLNAASGAILSSEFEVKEMAVEVERAVEQVNKSLLLDEESTKDK